MHAFPTESATLEAQVIPAPNTHQVAHPMLTLPAELLNKRMGLHFFFASQILVKLSQDAIGPLQLTD